ncbi:MAG: RHS repeat-associated core domain-containing protein, partial [Thermoguttaceae bacterium]|nr:RHS repeat-associated core domain-containing protein [Thermoguttaceae bacterium]
STGAMNRLASDGVYNYQYDARGNRTLRTKISDNTKTEYTWDHRNRLTGVKFKSAGGTVTKEVQYSYDAFNRLVRRRLDADGAGAGGFTDTFWVYDGDEAILEFAGGAATAPSHRYLWGPAVDQILADEQVATGSPNDVRWPMTDWQGTIRDVATYNAATNVTTIANHKVYEAFGKVHSESGPTVDTIFGFTGRYFDDDTGLQWNLNRWYDAVVGRWLSEDPIGFAAGDPNLYRYVGNSPGMFGDPDGLQGRPSTVADLAPDRVRDSVIVRHVIEIVEEMKAEKWKPSNPNDPGEFGKEFERRLNTRLAIKASRWRSCSSSSSMDRYVAIASQVAQTPPIQLLECCHEDLLICRIEIGSPGTLAESAAFFDQPCEQGCDEPGRRVHLHACLGMHVGAVRPALLHRSRSARPGATRTGARGPDTR